MTLTSHKRGRPPLFSEDDLAFIRSRVTDVPTITTRDLAAELTARLKKVVRHSTVAASLKRLGVRKVRPATAPKVPPARRYGYTALHRRSGDHAYPSSVTDAEWDLVKTLFERTGPGRPEQYSRRAIFDAISYVVRSGCAWRMLPKDMPPWTIVYATFRRWSDEGLFEAMHDRMRDLWRVREGRETSPTASVLDSQSVRTAEKGGSTDSTRARRSRAESGTS